MTMVEMLQWAVDQYGYMLYGIQPRFQKLLELELKVAYGSRLDAVIANVPSPVSEPLSLPLQHQQPVGPLDHDQPMRSGEEISFGHVEDPTTVPQSGILSTSAPSALYSTPLSPTVPLRPILPRQGSAGTRHTRPPLASQTHAVSAHSPSNLEQDLGITVTELQRWDKSEEEDPASVAVPAYSQSIMENAQAAVSSLEELLRRYPPL